LISISALPAPVHNPLRRTTYEPLTQPIRVIRRSGRASRIGELGWLTGHYSDGLARVVWDRDEIYGSVVRPEAIRRVEGVI
jgi:hypothetical protein